MLQQGSTAWNGCLKPDGSPPRKSHWVIPAQTSRCFTSNLPCKASVVRNSSETNTPSSRTAPPRAAGLNTRRPLGKVVQHCIHCIHMASGWILTRDPHNHSPPHRFSPPLSLRPCPGIFWRWLAPWFLVGVSPNYGWAWTELITTAFSQR